MPSGVTISAGTDAASAIPVLMERHGPRLRAVALRMCRNADDADDLVQDVFLQAFRKWHTFRGEADPATWLYAIAVRACRAKARRQRRASIPATSVLMPWRETTVMAVAAAPAGEHDEPERAEAIARVQSSVAKLPEHLRLPLLLKEMLGLSVHDTAAALGLAEGTVKTRLHRARLALRKTMTSRAKSVDAPPPIYERQVCLDLLKAKMEAMDRGGSAAGFRVPQAEVCARCSAVFRELDMVQDACAQLSRGTFPQALKAKILRELRKRDAEVPAGAQRPRRGRRPVRGSPSSARK